MLGFNKFNIFLVCILMAYVLSPTNTVAFTKDGSTTPSAHSHILDARNGMTLQNDNVPSSIKNDNQDEDFASNKEDEDLVTSTEDEENNEDFEDGDEEDNQFEGDDGTEPEEEDEDEDEDEKVQDELDMGIEDISHNQTYIPQEKRVPSSFKVESGSALLNAKNLVQILPAHLSTPENNLLQSRVASYFPNEFREPALRESQDNKDEGEGQDLEGEEEEDEEETGKGNDIDEAENDLKVNYPKRGLSEYTDNEGQYSSEKKSSNKLFGGAFVEEEGEKGDFNNQFSSLLEEIADVTVSQLNKILQEKGANGSKQSFLKSEEATDAAFFNQLKDKLVSTVKGPIKQVCYSFLQTFLPHVESWVAKGIKPPTMSADAYERLFKPVAVSVFNQVEHELNTSVPDDIFDLSS